MGTSLWSGIGILPLSTTSIILNMQHRQIIDVIIFIDIENIIFLKVFLEVLCLTSTRDEQFDNSLDGIGHQPSQESHTCVGILPQTPRLVSNSRPTRYKLGDSLSLISDVWKGTASIHGTEGRSPLFHP
jgi:hypothetical protein